MNDRGITSHLYPRQRRDKDHETEVDQEFSGGMVPRRLPVKKEVIRVKWTNRPKQTPVIRAR